MSGSRSGVSRPRSSPGWLRGILFFALALFVAGGLFSGYLFYSTVRALAATGDVPSFPNLSGGWAKPQAQEGTPEPAPAPVWSRKERVNLLLLGVDKRPGETGPVRTDTIIVMTLDPETKTGGFLSLPRDLWVAIPTVGEERINTAHFFGDERKYPGGGPALAMKTVSAFLGVPVHGYIRVDFQGFKKLIDAIGGVDIVVEAPIDDMEYPTDDYGIQEVHIPAGKVHMDGDLALKYARVRHGSSDIDRATRQQQVIRAAVEKALHLNLLPKAPTLISTLLEAVKTDFQPAELIALARLASQIDQAQIQSRVIGYDMAINTMAPGGAEVLVPIRDKIRPVVDELFSTPQPANPNRLASEAASVEVLNGAGVVGAAAQVAAYLQAQGFSVVSIENADRPDYPSTVIINRGGKPYTAARLAELLRVAPGDMRTEPMVAGQADIVVIVGRDCSIATSP